MSKTNKEPSNSNEMLVCTKVTLALHLLIKKEIRKDKTLGDISSFTRLAIINELKRRNNGRLLF